MSFPPPPPPGPPPPPDTRQQPPAQAYHSPMNSLQNGMNYLQVAPPNNAYPQQHQHQYHHHGALPQAHPSATYMQTAPPNQCPPAPAPARLMPPPMPNQVRNNDTASPFPMTQPIQLPHQPPQYGYPGSPTQQMLSSAPPTPSGRPPPPSQHHHSSAHPTMRLPPPPPPSPFNINSNNQQTAFNTGFLATSQSFQTPQASRYPTQPSYAATPNRSHNPPPPAGPPRPTAPKPPPHPAHPEKLRNQSQPKIDPTQIPRPPLFIRPNDNGPLPIYAPKAAAAQTRSAPPPPADSRYLVYDDGNASPQLIRSNFYTVPTDRATWQKLGEVDMGLICSPMALPSQDFVPSLGPQPEDGNANTNSSLKRGPQDPQRVPFVQGTPGVGTNFRPPPRCRTCGAYVNPYWAMDTNTCNFCGTRNAIADINFEVVCLQKGTVDLAVDGPYVTRASPVQPTFLYALDLTSQHLEEYVVLLEQVGIDLGRHFQQQPAHQELWQRQEEQEGSNHGADTGINPNGPRVRQQRLRIGICFVASFGIVILTRGPQGATHAAIMPDVTEDPFCHVPLQQWTFDVSSPEGVDQWINHVQEQLLDGDLIKNMRKEAGKRNPYGLDGFECSCGGAAMAFCADALSETGGRATWISSRRPNFGVGSIRQRGLSAQSRQRPLAVDAFSLQNLPKTASNEQDLKAAAFYRKLQEKCAKDRVVIDIVIHSNPEHVYHQSLDLCTQAELCRATCGKLTWIAAPDMGWKEPLMEELRRPLLCFQGWDAVFKVRCSDGLQVKKFISHPGAAIDGGGLAMSPELELACVTPQTNLAILVEHQIGGIPKKSPFVFVQSALLYTTPSGHRRVRVSTLALRPSLNVPDIFLSIDFACFTTLFLRRAVARLRELATQQSSQDPNAVYKQARDDITQQMVKILVSYRQHTNAVNSPRGQLILPEKLQLLPLFCMCLLKSPMLRPSLGRRVGPVVVVSPTNDERSYHAFQATMVGPQSAFLLVHPNVFFIGKPLPEGVGNWKTPPGRVSTTTEISQASYRSFVQLPATVNASMTCLQDDGVYLIDNGLVIYLFVGKDVPQDVSRELAHLPISLSMSSASQTLTEYGERVRRVVWQLRSFCSDGSSGSRSDVRPVFPAVIPCRQGDPRDLLFEQELMLWMVDDPSAGEKDYTDFLCKLHRLIRDSIDPPSKK